MATYSAETFNNAHQATGIVTPVEDYLTAEQRKALPIDAPRPRYHDDKERLCVDIECIRRIEKFGRPTTEVYTVRVPESPEAYTLEPGPVQFIGLSVNVYPKDKYLTERWSAEGFVEVPDYGREE